MRSAMGVERNGQQLEEALSRLADLPLPNEIHLLGRAILLSALNRTESRGSHHRSDYPDKIKKEKSHADNGRIFGGRRHLRSSLS